MGDPNEPDAIRQDDKQQTILLNQEAILESLSRTLLEIEAVKAIFGCYDEQEEEYNDGNDASDNIEDSPTSLSVLDPQALKECQRILEHYETNNDSLQQKLVSPPPRINLEVRLQQQEPSFEQQNASTTKMATTVVTLHIGLPPGYPIQSAIVSCISWSNSTRNERDTMTRQLSSKALDLAGNETVLELIQTCQDFVCSHSQSKGEKEQDLDADQKTPDPFSSTNTNAVSRRWIWVHHITNTGRRKDIMAQARDLSLGGYLKSGYPGIVVVEGTVGACDDFVKWIKGNKSRPDGGFGRNWGHHERGQALVDQRNLPDLFEEIPNEYMGTLGALCETHGVQDEFRAYVLQHSGN